MYNNIGAKIKLLAQIIAWVGIAGSFLAGIALLSDYGASGLIIFIGGPFLAWVSSWLCMGLGN